jgi:phospholipid/cholesterol/gamma-HCH transport system substrate-binding protein
MDEDIQKLRVGIFVVIAMLILGILIFLNSEGWMQQYTLYIKPVSAPGVTVGTPIRKYGILIGRVESVSSEDDCVLLGLAINEDEVVYENEIASIGTESFLGDAVVEILPLTKQLRGEAAVPGSMISKVAVKRNPMEIVDVALNMEQEIAETLRAVRLAGQAVDNAGDGVRDLMTTVTDAMNDEDSEFKKLVTEFRQTSQKAQVAIENFNQIFENVNEMVGDPEVKVEFRRSIATLPKILEEIQNTVVDTRKTINSFQEVSGKASSSLDNIEVFTGSLKDNGPEILVQVKESLRNVDGLVVQVKDFTQSLKKLQSSEGTIGKLLNDSEVYDDIKSTVENARMLSIQLEPLVNDLRNFADSLARDPGIIGVRGALDRRPGKTGYKGTAGREGGLFH